MASQSLSPAIVYGSDPLARGLGRLRVSPAAAGLFFLLAGVLYTLILPYLWGLSFQINGDDLIYGFLILVVYPVSGYFYARQPRSILAAYESMKRYLRDEDQARVFHLDSIERIHARPIIWVIGLLFGLLGAGFGAVYSLQHYGEFWYSVNGFEIFLVQGARLLAFYCIGVCAARHIAASRALNKLFEHADLPLTLDADRLEIFRKIKNFALEFVGVSAVIALNLGLQPLFVEPPALEYAIYVALYFIVAPLSFFLPIWEAHRRMTRVKNEMLDRLHYDFQEESQRLRRKFGEASASYVEEAGNLERLERSIAAVSKALEWPFEGTTVYRLVVTVTSPFLFILFEIFINIVSNLFVSN